MENIELSDILYFSDLLRLRKTHNIEVVTDSPLRIAIPLLRDNLVKFYEIAENPNSLFPIMVCYLSHPKLDYIR